MNSTKSTFLKAVVGTSVMAALMMSPFTFAHEPEQGKEETASSEKTVTGEIVDLMCYVDHNAIGEKHMACGAKCIQNGGPVGIVENGKAYLVVGEHKPINGELADACGKTVTLKGKLAERGGMAMLENAEIVKK